MPSPTPTPSSSKRRRLSAADKKPSTPQFNKFRVSSSPHFETAFHVVMLLETVFPTWNLLAKPNLKSQFILTPKDSATYHALRKTTHVDERPIPIVELTADVRPTKAVLMKFPVYMDLKILTDLPNVLAAERCVTGRGRNPTRSVLITFEGPAPKKVELRTWGAFPVRQYTPEPLRCFQCNRFGHLKATCTGPHICGVCSGRHDTERCISALKEGKKVKACCPNCSQNHHAWNLRCPARVKRIHGRRFKPETNPRMAKKSPPQKPATSAPEAATSQQPAVPPVASMPTAPVAVPRKAVQKREFGTQTTPAPVPAPVPAPPPASPAPGDLVSMEQVQRLLMVFITQYSAMMGLECNPALATAAFQSAMRSLNDPEEAQFSEDEDDIHDSGPPIDQQAQFSDDDDEVQVRPEYWMLHKKPTP